MEWSQGAVGSRGWIRAQHKRCKCKDVSIDLLLNSGLIRRHTCRTSARLCCGRAVCCCPRCLYLSVRVRLSILRKLPQHSISFEGAALAKDKQRNGVSEDTSPPWVLRPVSCRRRQRRCSRSWSSKQSCKRWVLIKHTHAGIASPLGVCAGAPCNPLLPAHASTSICQQQSVARDF